MSSTVTYTFPITHVNNKIFIFATSNGYVDGILCLLYNTSNFFFYYLHYFGKFQQFFILPIMPCGCGKFKNLKHNAGNINKMKLKLQITFISFRERQLSPHFPLLEACRWFFLPFFFAGNSPQMWRTVAAYTTVVRFTSRVKVTLCMLFLR